MIGAGVVGLSVARIFAMAGREVALIERHETFGTQTSSRNSEVIHAGLQYQPASLRARLCVSGRERLYGFCAQHNVAHKKCGKLILAQGEKAHEKLSALAQRARANGAGDFPVLSRTEAQALEPALECAAALWVDESGIIDSHGFMQALLAQFESAGGVFAPGTEFKHGEIDARGVGVVLGGVDGDLPMRAKLVINCAGLASAQLARNIAGLSDDFRPKLYFAKGQYFAYGARSPFSRLIYPLPKKDAQGIHVTHDLSGRLRLGPDINFVSDPGALDVDVGARAKFAAAAKDYWPSLDESHLYPDYAGMRPKLAGEGQEGRFMIAPFTLAGRVRYIGLHGIESPGLTASLAIADYVLAQVNGH